MAWAGVDETDCVIEGLDRHHRQDRSEDLVGHQRLGRVGVDDDGGLDAVYDASEPPPSTTSPLVAASVAGEPVEVALIHDALAAGSSDSNVVTAALILSTSSSRIFASAST